MNQKKYEDEIPFKDLIKKPVRLFGWVYVYFFIIITGLGLYYVLNLDSISINNGPYPASDSSAFPQDVEMKKGSVIPAADLSKLKSPSDSLLNSGKELYTQNCQSCHGAGGKGDGPAGSGLNPAPRDFTNPDSEWKNDKTISGMYKTLQEGIEGTSMAAYEYLPVEEKFAIIHYVRDFGDYPEITEDQIAELDREYKLSEGRTTANQIPVSLAMQKLSEESPAVDINAKKLLVEVSDSSAGKKIFKNIAADENRVLASFITSNLNESFDIFKSSVTLTPIELGYKAEIISMPAQELRKLFDLLKILQLKIDGNENRSV